MDQKPRRSPAEELFAHYLERVNAGEEVDFQAVCRDNPELADELRSLSLSGGSEGQEGLDGLSPIADEIFERLSRRPAIQGRYKLEGEVARGGMGAILRVWDEDLHRHLAMKVVLGRDTGEAAAASSLDAMTLGRFLEEAQVTGQLDHPGIVPVHEVGLDGKGHLFFTMKLVKGRDLREIYKMVREGSEGWTATRAIGLLLRACEAMAYAHDKGVVHRDLKPGNVMVGRFGEVYVMDWGLAKVLDREDNRDLRIQEELEQSTLLASDRKTKGQEDPSSPLLTMDGDILGTPAYMSPEQATGRLSDMGPHSDVYSLGAMLYQLLAGHAPYADPKRRRSHIEVLTLVRLQPPEPLEDLAPDAPQEIVAICEKAMAREPADRYPDMAALAEDLRAYMEGRVVGAYETGPVAELRKWVTRNRGFAAAVLSAVLALVVGLVVSLSLRNEAVRQRQNVLQLSAFQRLDKLEERADQLWPIHPNRVRQYEVWLDDADELIAELDQPGGHRDQLEELRSRATRFEGEALERRMATHERYEELLQMEARLAWYEYAESVRSGTAEPIVFELPEELQELPPAALNDELAWPMVEPGRTNHGHEAKGLALARLAVEKAREIPDLPVDDLCNYLDTLAWAYLANGMNASALATANDSLEMALPALKGLYRENLANIRTAIESSDSSATEKEHARLAEQVRLLRDEVSAEHLWRFEDEDTRWWHTQLAKLVQDLERFRDQEVGLIRGKSSETGLGIEERLELAQRIERLSVTSERAIELWAEARGAIALNPLYGGLDLSPQVGLLPLGVDPFSNLWEFAHVASGEIPRRDRSGELQVNQDSCIVLVLIPGGTFTFGCQTESEDEDNFDPQGRADEAPTKVLELDPYFLSKYELTQAQWLEFEQTNPSRFLLGNSAGGRQVTASNPVEEISWRDCLRFVTRADLALPTEAQWEFAARAGTVMPWSRGFERESLIGFANIEDRSAFEANEPFAQDLEWKSFDDGFSAHAAVGTFEPNAFGLHDMLGNVSEWCMDLSGNNYLPFRSGDGLRMRDVFRMRRARGGSFTDVARDCRVTSFRSYKEDYKYVNLGVRPSRRVMP